MFYTMFTLFSGRHLVYHGGTPTWRFHAGLYKFFAKHFDEYLTFGETHRPKTWRSVLFIYLLQHDNILAFSIE